MPSEINENLNNLPQTEPSNSSREPLNISPDVLESLRRATLPDEFVRIVLESIAGIQPRSPVAEEAFPLYSETEAPSTNLRSAMPIDAVPEMFPKVGTNVSIEPQSWMETPWTTPRAANPQIVNDVSVKLPDEVRAQPFYLADLQLDLREVAHMTPGLRAFKSLALGDLFANTLFGGGLPPALLQQSPRDRDGQDREEQDQDNEDEDLGGEGEGEPPAQPIQVRIPVRFFIVDECGGRKLKNQTGLLKGVVYEEKFPNHIGTLSRDTVSKIFRLLDGANRIWTPYGIEFEFLDTMEGPFIHALDLDALPFEITANVTETGVQEFLQFDTDRPIPIRVLESMNLCSFFDLGTKRNLTVHSFFKSVPVRWSKIVWDFDKPEYGAVKGQRVTDKDIRDAQATRPASDQQAYADLLNLGKRRPTLKRSVEQYFTHAIDAFHGQEGINVYVVENFEDTGEAGIEAGMAPIGTQKDPGRSVFLDDRVVVSNDKRVLAHEFGHCLGLDHDYTPNNLMIPGGRGTMLKSGAPDREDQREIALAVAKEVPK